MQNYEIIRSYLKTFPKGTTVDTVINNIDKAVDQFNENKKKREISRYVGRYFFKEEYDDGKLMVRFIFKVKEITPDNQLKGIVLILPSEGMFVEDVVMERDVVDSLTEEIDSETMSELLFSKTHSLSGSDV